MNYKKTAAGLRSFKHYEGLMLIVHLGKNSNLSSNSVIENSSRESSALNSSSLLSMGFDLLSFRVTAKPAPVHLIGMHLGHDTGCDF
jgi:hypothetical protein